jgi:hypothetical protein
MGEIFKGWRRTTGVLTLLAACVFMGGWVRSGWIADGIWYPTDTSSYFVDSLHGVIRLYIATPDKSTPVFRGRRFTFSSENARSAPFAKFNDKGEPMPFDPWEKLDVIRRLDWLGINIGTANFKESNSKVEMCVIHYWSIVIPMTLMSLWFLLSRPRKSTQKKIAAPIPEKVA